METNLGRVIQLIAALLMTAGTPAMADGHGERLTAALRAQPAEARARYVYRRPAQTLEFFGVKPGMTVVEVLPGRGWYSKVLLPYLGSEGQLIGADYTWDMLPLFGFYSDARLEAKKTWVDTWPRRAEDWRGVDGASVSAFVLGSMPDAVKGSADVVLLIRALHNLARFEQRGGYLTSGLTDVYDVLKPGGVVGVVQHHARDDRPDEWANGSNGYLKKSFVIARMEAAGFKYVGETDINTNPKDRPGDSDFVWRLPPPLPTSRQNTELRGQMEAVGESNRMTLKFVKPE